MKKYLKISILLFVLFFLYIYVVSVTNLPAQIEIFKGEKIDIKTLWGIDITRENKSIETSNNLSSNIFYEPGQEKLQVSLFEKIKLKTINVSVLEDVEVVPVGEVVGIKLYTNGVLVVGTSRIEGEDGNFYKPYENCGIEEGDSIIQINDVVINNTDELISEINKNYEKLEITYTHDDETKTAQIVPVKVKDGEYKIGLWVRDSSAGVGTITFYNEETKCFAALGHAITDIDTGKIINTSSGEIDNVKIISVIKGESEEPGKIEGAIINNTPIGNIYNNSKFGIYGVIDDVNKLNIDFSRKMKVASRREIKLGEATCLCGVDGEVKEYKVEISQIYLNNNYDNKSMIIKITDDELIEKTGGIIQGMSGSPLIQNGKFIGAITHVLISNPKVGYAVFGDLMLKY